MKKLFLTILFILMLAIPGWATTYYVDNTCADNEGASSTPDGTSYDPTTPACTGGSDNYYVSIDDLNAKTFSAGDKILFRSGQTWTPVRWDLLGSGSDGNPIVVDRFAGTTRPILDAGVGGTAFGIHTNGMSWWTFNNLELTHGSSWTVYVHRPSSGIIFDNLYVHDADNDAFGLGWGGTGASSNITVQNCIIDSTWDNGIIASGAITDITIKNNTLTNIGTRTPTPNGLGIFIAIDGNVGTVTISGNHITSGNIAIEMGGFGYHPTGTITISGNVSVDSRESGMEDFGSGAVWTYNRITGAAGHGIFIRNASVGSKALYNVIWNNAMDGIRTQEGTKGVLIYGNTLYQNNSGNSASYAEINIDSTTSIPTTASVKNNIIYPNGTNKSLRVVSPVGAGHDIDYNLYAINYTGMILWQATSYDTLGAFVSAQSQDTNGVVADPLFTNAGSNDFTLLAGSPAIDTGVDLGAAYDDALHPDSSWPNNIVTVDQESYGAGWERGSYVKTTIEPPRGFQFIPN